MTLTRMPRRAITLAPRPLWQQSADSIAKDIRAGIYLPGARLPAERELCQVLGVSRVTLRKGLASLAADGVIVVADGRGWFVPDPPASLRPDAQRREWPTTLESFGETAERMDLVATSTVLLREIRAATIDEAEELGIVPGMPLFRLVRVRMLGGMPIARDESSLPAALIDGILDVDFTTASLYATLERAGIVPSIAETTIEARAADESLAEHLGVDLHSPTLTLHQLVTDLGSRPVLSSTIRYAGDRYRLRTSFARFAGPDLK
ncbi:MAG: GntR family transcriptional regulator, N-acetylglucosamine utilization regulator [Microbacteriaceae bacterium]|jgi:GntR family transcriptional regulator|nr:GntR family transcriptional regulator, N-acetylglucosamine utilization regulator [Microbacteriaceae bacterium]